MARRFYLFNFLEKKMTNAELAAIISKTMSEIALRELALHIAISYVANILSKCEIKTYQNGKEVKGMLYYALNVSPNYNQNASQFINKVIEKYYYDGHALVVKTDNGQLHCADYFTVDESNPLKEFVYENVTFGSTQVKKRYKASEVFYFKLDNEHARKLIDKVGEKYEELMGYAVEAYKRTNGRKYKLILEQYRAGDPQFKTAWEDVLQKQLKTFLENNNAVYPQFKGTDLTEFSTATPTTSDDIVSLRKEMFEITAQAIKLPLTLMYGNITNIDEVFKVVLAVVADPLADMMSEETTRKYYGFEGWKDGNYVEVDTSCIKYVDILEVADKVDKAIASGLCNIDELRKRVRLNALNTDFSTAHFITKNYELASNVLKGEKGGEANEKVLLNGADRE